jgi:hypothetical protein
MPEGSGNERRRIMLLYAIWTIWAVVWLLTHCTLISP